MSLFRSILHGFGFELGAEAARRVVREVEADLEQQPAPQAPPKQGRLHALRRRWTAAREARGERRAARQREQAIEAELRALKRRDL